MPSDGETLHWLSALLDPWSVIKNRAGHRQEVVAAALLHLGEVEDYRDERSEGLPTFEDPVRHAGDPAAQYLEGLVLRFLGRHDDARERFFEVGSDSSVPAGLRLVSLIRARAAAHLLLDKKAAQQAMAAVREMSEEVAQREIPLLIRATAILQLAEEHLGNDDQEAAAAAYQTSAEVAKSLSTAAVAALAEVVQYAAELGGQRAIRGSSRTPFSPLVERSRLADVAEAFAEQGDGRFRQVLAGPFQERKFFASADRLERALTASLLLAEAYGSVSLVRWSSGALAKHWLARSREPGAPEPAVEDLLLLVQSGDTQAVSRAAHALWMGGPVDVLKKAGSIVLGGNWRLHVEPAALHLLSRSADVLSPAEADRAVDRILSLLGGPLDRPYDLVYEVLVPLAQAVPSASGSSQLRVADALLRLVEARNATVLLDFAVVTWKIRWRDVEDDLRSRWVEVVSDLLLSGDEGSRTRHRAAGALVSLLRSGENAARGKALETFEERPDGLTAAVLLEAAFPDGPDRVLSLLVEEVRRLLDEPPHADALFGRVFWFTPNPASLLATALLQYPAMAGAWEDLQAFLADDRIPAVARVDPARLLAQASGALSPAVTEQLRPLANSLLEEAEQEAGFLPFTLAFGDIPASTAMRVVSSLLGDSNIHRRISGLQLLSYAGGPLSALEVVALALPLTYDAQVAVRAEAAAALVRLPELSPEGRRRVLDLLESPGAAVPRAVLRSFLEPTETSTSALLGDAVLVAEAHASAEIRDLGRRVLEVNSVPPPGGP